MSGRPTTCTPETIKAICDNISLGMNNRDAAALAGIGESTLYDWIQRGKQELERVSSGRGRKVHTSEAPFVEFTESFRRAIPRRKQALIGRIQQAAKGGRQWTETRERYENKNGEPTLIERTVTTKEEEPNWNASAWLLERLHPDEFGRRQEITITWEQDIVQKLRRGEISPADVLAAFPPDLATRFFTEAGIHATASDSD